MSLTFKRTGDADYPRFLKVLVQGPPKSGKTTFASTAPNVVFLALPDAGLMSIAHKNVPYRDVEDPQDLQMLQLMLADPLMRDKLAKSLGLPAIETIVIDTLDSLQELMKKAILKANRATEMRQADWGKLKEHLSAVVKGYVALPINVIFTVHTTTVQDDEQRIIHAPALQGAIKDEIAGWVDFSLLAERKREFDKDGKPRIVYTLKAEGDQKNPHLGNRAAGRLPEYIEPEFKVLHDGVFAGIDNLVKTQVVEAEAPGPAEEVALPESRKIAETVVAATQPKIPAATGVPTLASDAHEHINSAGIKALSRSLTEVNLSLPDFSQEVWTLGFARDTAKYIVACKADEKLGRGNAAQEVITYLKAHGVDLIVANYVPPEPEPKKVTPKVVNKAAVKDPVKEEVTEDAAIATLEAQVGAVVVGERVSPDAKCAECNNPVDDLEIANLAISRFRRPLCLKDYLAANKTAKENA